MKFNGVMMGNKFSDKGRQGTIAKNVWVFFRSTYSTWLIFSLSLCITFIAWTITSKSNQNHSHDLFTFEVAQTLQAIEQRMQGYQQILRGGIGLFKSSKPPSEKRRARTMTAFLHNQGPASVRSVIKLCI